jgi:hypothetical protein
LVGRITPSHARSANLRYNEQKWLNATAQLVADDTQALQRFIGGDVTVFSSNQFNQLGGLPALAQFRERDEVFEALRQSSLVRHQG